MSAATQSALPIESYPDRMTPKQVATVLNVNERHVRTLIHAGALEGINLGARGCSYYRVNRDSVVAFMAKNKTV
ncbi:MAG TPA: helix-turn-helix domain-containing protein [Verrucomicrobiae bacterium]|jgi:excisionase family DNA binding protein|nr:helix-turn-helix domain-containing protein [Verrucomicrobiae bacterium]